MLRVGAVAAVTTVLALLAAGCGGGSGGTVMVVRTVTTPSRPRVQSLSLAQRVPEAPRIERGHRPDSEVGCPEPRGGQVKAVYLRSEGETCVRVAPRDRLLFVNAVEFGPGGEEPGGVEVNAGPYRGDARVGRPALFTAPVGTYLGLGSHRVGTSADATEPRVLVLPEGCQVKETRPGESLCFAAGAPPCRSSELAIRAGQGGAGAGTYYGHPVLVNRSHRVCAVAGFPQVTPVDAAGQPLAPPFPTSRYASINGGVHPRRIVLEPGAAAVFAMNTGTAANYSRSACHPRKPASLEVRIPGAGGPPLSLPPGEEICATGTNVNIGPIE